MATTLTSARSVNSKLSFPMPQRRLHDLKLFLNVSARSISVNPESSSRDHRNGQRHQPTSRSRPIMPQIQRQSKRCSRLFCKPVKLQIHLLHLPVLLASEKVEHQWLARQPRLPNVRSISIVADNQAESSLKTVRLKVNIQTLLYRPTRMRNLSCLPSSPTTTRPKKTTRSQTASLVLPGKRGATRLLLNVLWMLWIPSRSWKSSSRPR